MQAASDIKTSAELQAAALSAHGVEVGDIESRCRRVHRIMLLEASNGAARI